MIKELLYTIDHYPEPAICFVLPRKLDTARLIALIHSAMHSQSENTPNPDIRPGQKVRIKPDGPVFLFRGSPPDQPNQITLETLNGKGKLYVDKKFLLRIEPTDLTSPKGKLNSEITAPATALDQLFNKAIQGCYKRDCIQTYLLDTLSQFDTFTQEHTIAQTVGVSAKLAELLPVGVLNVEGQCFNRQTHDLIAAPMVITHSIYDLIDAVQNLQPHTATIILNNLSAQVDAGQLTTLKQQRLFLFCDRFDTNTLNTVHAAQIKIWPIDLNDLNDASTSTGLFGRLKQHAKVHNQIKVENQPCNGTTHHDVIEKLQALNPDAPITQNIWQLTNQIARQVVPPSSDSMLQLSNRLMSMQNDVKAQQTWLGLEQTSNIQSLIAILQNQLTELSENRSPKTQCLLLLLKKLCCNNQKIAIAVLQIEHGKIVADWLKKRYTKTNYQIITPGQINANSFLDHIVFLGWPGRHCLERLHRKLVVPNIHILTFPHEVPHILPFNQRILEQPNTFTQPREIATFLHRNEVPVATNLPHPLPVRLHPSILRLVNLEDRRKDGGAKATTPTSDPVEAHYVNFVGDAYAYLTSEYRLSRITNLINQTGDKVEEITLDELQPGDYVVFPNASTRTIISEIADQLIGKDAGEHRKFAHLWQDALIRSKRTPEELHTIAVDLKRPKVLSTFKCWLTNRSQIGPGRTPYDRQEDIELIELITQDAELQANKHRVYKAIDQLRSAHISAGQRLSSLLRASLQEYIHGVNEETTSVTIGEFGSALIVQVDQIETIAEMHEHSEVNKLKRI